MSIDIEKLFEGAYYDDEKNAASGTSEKSTKREENKADNTDTSDTDGSTAGGAHDLPPDFLEVCLSLVSDFCQKFNIEDMQKAAAVQWRACCSYLGMYAKNNNIYIDKEKSAKQGGRVYDQEKLLQTVDIWQFLCGIYKKMPLMTDFIEFAGISHSYLINNNGHSKLSSAGGCLYKKLLDIQQSGIASGIVDGRENPTGKIYFSKAVLGWSENGITRQNSDDIQENNGALPDLSLLSLPNNEKQ